jgi:glycosyltransferase involved in cell wall biosynthesis
MGGFDMLLDPLTERQAQPGEPTVSPAPGDQLPTVPEKPRADIDLVIPAFNEEHRIGPTVESICWQMARSTRTARIIVVDNGSVDATAEAVDRAARHDMDVSVISCQVPGKGAAVKAGIRAATAPLVGYVDADQSTPPDVLITGMAILDSGWDVVVGSRRAFGAEYVVPQDFVRRIGSRAFNLAASTVVGRMSDTQCGMKLFRTEAVRDLFESVILGGFAFDVEVLARARAAGLRIMEVPVSWSDSTGSSLRPFRHGVQAFGELNRLRRVLRPAR